MTSALALLPHLCLQCSPASGRSLHASTWLAAGSVVLEEPAFASLDPSLHRGDDRRALGTLAVHVGDGTLLAALPYYLQLEPNYSLLQAHQLGSATAATAQALFPAAVHTNGFTVKDNLQLCVLVASLSNHSCVPNIATSYRLSESGQPSILFTALRNIAAGEEITHSYVDSSTDVTDRRLRLAPYGFLCTCAACMAGT
jgi:hypothetical protein